MRRGLILAAISFLTIALSVVLLRTDYLSTGREFICAGMVLTGIVVWAWGHRLARKQSAGSYSAGAGITPPDITAFTMRYWGPLLSVFGAVVFFLSPDSIQKVMKVAEDGAAIIAWHSSVPPTKAAELKLSGIFVGEGRPAAIINGILYRVGERVGSAEVIYVHTNSVTLLTSAGTKTLSLRDWTVPTHAQEIVPTQN